MNDKTTKVVARQRKTRPHDARAGARVEGADRADQVANQLDGAPDKWTRIYWDYRAGILSIRLIAHIHGVSDRAIRKRAEKLGWKRDLADKVRAEAKRLLAMHPYGER